jgi:predicted Zn-dependent peptidase
VASGLAQFIALSGGLDSVDALYATYAAITPADIHAAAQSYLSAQRRTVGVLRTRTAH